MACVPAGPAFAPDRPSRTPGHVTEESVCSGHRIETAACRGCGAETLAARRRLRAYAGWAAARAEVVRRRTTISVVAMSDSTAQTTNPAIPAPTPPAEDRAPSIAS